jgi:hypothetical protein
MKPDCKYALDKVENRTLDNYSRDELDKLLEELAECKSEELGLKTSERLANAIDKINKLLKDK